MKMNKKVWALALAALVSAGTATISAANDDNKSCDKTEQACKARKDCQGKKECKGDAKMRHGRHGGKDCANPFFEGIELTADQQAAVKAFKDQQKAACEAKKEANREECQKAFMTEMKNVLTSEQYQQLEQNAAKVKALKAEKKDGQKGDMNKKGHKDGQRHGQRPDRAAQN